MSVIPCASVSLKTMADGTLRISFDIEPMHAQDAFRLFAAPGTPAAIAALQVGYASVEPIDASIKPVENDPEIKLKGGALAKLAGMWCDDLEFQSWINGAYVHGEPMRGSAGAAHVLRGVCQIDSRAELDHDTHSAMLFHSLIRGPFQKHLIARGIIS